MMKQYWYWNQGSQSLAAIVSVKESVNILFTQHSDLHCLLLLQHAIHNKRINRKATLRCRSVFPVTACAAVQQMAAFAHSRVCQVYGGATT
jgi:hypothetical protein